MMIRIFSTLKYAENVIHLEITLFLTNKKLYLEFRL